MLCKPDGIVFSQYRICDRNSDFVYQLRIAHIKEIDDTGNSTVPDNQIGLVRVGMDNRLSQSRQLRLDKFLVLKKIVFNYFPVIRITDMIYESAIQIVILQVPLKMARLYREATMIEQMLIQSCEKPAKRLCKVRRVFSIRVELTFNIGQQSADRLLPVVF